MPDPKATEWLVLKPSYDNCHWCGGVAGTMHDCRAEARRLKAEVEVERLRQALEVAAARMGKLGSPGDAVVIREVLDG